jgi:hypothetical protein
LPGGNVTVFKNNCDTESMGFADGMFIGMNRAIAAQNAGKPFMLVDYPKAKVIIETQLSRGKKITRAELGLQGDWDCNSCTVYDSKGHHEYGAYDGSMWAVPTLMLFYEDGTEESTECWKPELKALPAPE